MKVKNLMTDFVREIQREDDVMTVAKIMRDNDIGFLPVIDNDNKVIGVVTDRDIVTRVIAMGENLYTKVDDVMTFPVYTVREEDELGVAAKQMSENQIRRLVVVDASDKLAGVISLGDLATSQMTDDRAKTALTSISKPSNDTNHGLEIGDFPL